MRIDVPSALRQFCGLLSMANTRSAAKQARAALRRKAGNIVVKSSVRKAEKEIRTLAKAGKKEEALKLVASFQSKIDKAAKTKVLHKNKASRQKAKIAKLLK
jgi:small subunit ribosomal protein S20